MALQIIENNGTFYVHGKINTSTTKSFLMHFEYVLNQRNVIIINIDALGEIDRDGFKVLNFLSQSAQKKNKELQIVGNVYTEMYDAFDSNHVA